jgi:hypothetical protein
MSVVDDDAGKCPHVGNGEQMNTTLDLTTRLEEMQDDYTYRVNMLLEENREDLAAELADQYTEEATRVLRSVQN